MPENILISFSRIIIILNIFDKLNRNTSRRLISEFEMFLKKIINFARLFHTTIVFKSDSL